MCVQDLDLRVSYVDMDVDIDVDIITHACELILDSINGTRNSMILMM